MTNIYTLGERWSDEDPSAVSFGERSLWSLDQLERTSPAYNVCVSLHVHGDFNLDHIAKAVEQLGRRHEALRTYFHDEGGSLRRRVSGVPLAVSRVDLANLSPSEQKERLVDRERDEARTVLRLDRPPLSRFAAIRMSATYHVLIVTLHHIICDGWSLRVLMNEFSRFCAASRVQQRIDLGPMPLQGWHYAEWQTQFMTTPHAATQVEYWRSTIASSTFVPFSLGIKRFAPPSIGGYENVLPQAISQAVTLSAAAHGVSPFAVLVSAISVAFWAMSDCTDILLGVDFANRDQLGAHEIVGLLTNQLPVWVDIDPDASFANLCSAVNDSLVQSARNSAVPFSRLLEIIKPQRSSNRWELLGTKVVDRGNLTSPITVRDYRVIPQPVPSPTVKYELAIFIERGNDTRIVYEYDAGIVSNEVIACHSDTVIESLRRVSFCPTLTLRELGDGILRRRRCATKECS